MAGGARKSADSVLIAALAGGMKIQTAADKAGVSEATAHRRLKDPDFVRRVNEARAAMLSEALGHLTSGSTEAAVVLRHLTLNSADERTKLAAARAVLEFVVKIREQTALVDEVAALREEMEVFKRGNSNTTETSPRDAAGSGEADSSPIAPPGEAAG